MPISKCLDPFILPPNYISQTAEQEVNIKNKSVNLQVKFVEKFSEKQNASRT